MSTPVNILSSSNKTSVMVTNRGQLVTSPLEFSISIFKSLDTDDTAFNFFKPLAGKRFVITDIIADADRNVGQNGAAVNIYESSAIDSTTVDTNIFKFDMAKQSDKALTGLNIITTEGKFINGKTDDNNVLVTICGYFVNV